METEEEEEEKADNQETRTEKELPSSRSLDGYYGGEEKKNKPRNPLLIGASTSVLLRQLLLSRPLSLQQTSLGVVKVLFRHLARGRDRPKEILQAN